MPQKNYMSARDTARDIWRPKKKAFSKKRHKTVFFDFFFFWNFDILCLMCANHKKIIFVVQILWSLKKNFIKIVKFLTILWQSLGGLRLGKFPFQPCWNVHLGSRCNNWQPNYKNFDFDFWNRKDTRNLMKI